MSRGKIYVDGIPAGILEKRDGEFYFTYDDDYFTDQSKPSVSLTLIKSQKEYNSKVLFPFFYGLLAEGELKEIQCRTLKIDENDHFTRLLKTAGKDVIGSVTVEEIE
jgi:HipA-like protein